MSVAASPEFAQVEKLLKVAFDNHATELRLSGGVPPMLRINEQLRQLKIKPIAAEELAGLIAAVLPAGADRQKFVFSSSHGPIAGSVVEVSGTQVLVLQKSDEPSEADAGDMPLELDMQEDERDEPGSGVRVRSMEDDFAMPQEAGGTIQIDKLLTAAVKGGVSDIHITVGQPPVFRQDGGMKPQKTKVLTADDTNGLMKSITPERCQAELAERGALTSALPSATWPGFASACSSSGARWRWCCGRYPTRCSRLSNSGCRMSASGWSPGPGACSW